MTPATNARDAASRLGLRHDEALILQSAATALLAAVVRGEVDLQALAAEELANRGVDRAGRWVGFPRAAEIHQVR